MKNNVSSELEAMDWLENMGRAIVSNTLPDGGIWSDVDGPSLLAAASSLQLIPANAHFLIRLQRLAAVAARIPAKPDVPRLSSSMIKKLLADPFVSGTSVRVQEDPYEGIYVTEVPFFGRARTVIEGTAQGCARVASGLLAAVFGAPEGTLPAGYVARVRALATCLLRLSDIVCRSAALDRGSGAADPGRAVTVPSAQRIAEMSRCVQFGATALWADMPPYVREYLVAVLVQDGADVPSWREGEVIDDGIILKPLIRSGKTLTLASPGDLMASLRHHIISESYEWGCSEALAGSLADATAVEARSLLGSMSDHSWNAVESGQGYVRSVMTFDQDKTLDLICLVDDLTNYDQFAIFQPWQAPALSERIHEIFTSADSAPEKTLRLIAYQGVGRDMAFGIPDSATSAPTLFLPLEDLEVILQSPGTDHMTLWYFALARERLEKEVRVLSFSAADVFAFYHEHNESFYIGDNAKPSLMNIDPGYGQKLRIDNYRRFDRHWVVDPQAKVLSEATAIHGRESSPVYLVLGGSQASMIVETDRSRVWVRLGRNAEGNAGSSTFDLGQAVAYWFWQLLAACPSFLDQDNHEGRWAEIEVTSHAAGSESSADPEHHAPWISTHRDDSGLLRLNFGTPPPASDTGAANYLDRLVVEALLRAFPRWGPAGSSGTVTAELLDKVAPPGPKQIIHVYGNGTDVTELPGSLPEARRLQAAPVARVLDDLGDYLTTKRGLTPGPIEDDQRTSFLNENVTKWLMDQLDDSVRSLNGEGLLEKLVTFDEALTSETAREPAQLRARLACFGAADDQVRRLQDYQSKAVASSLASRFLIEYATALAPSGDCPLTNESYDHMLALASEIVNKGMLSDAIRHNISEAEIAVLDSGRLGISRDEDKYHQALTHFGSSRAQHTFEAAVDGLKDPAVDNIYSLAEADQLAVTEFGFSFTDLADACGAIIGLGDDGAFRDVLRVDEQDVRSKLKEELAWGVVKVEAVLSALCLDPRATTAEEYWNDGIRVFPWRFNRELSYLRRPLLRTGPQGTAQLVAGRRRVWQTPSYWLEQFNTGRLQAKTKPMKTALNKIRNAKGDAFELTVAKRLETAGLTGVRSRVSRVGRHDFRNIDGLNLGDIDAIGVDQFRKRIYVIEAKDFEVARTPAELANEIDNVLLSDKAAVKRLAQRANWVRRHVATTLTELGVIAQNGTWIVEPLIVVDERLLSARLSSSDIPILGISELETYLLAANGRTPRRAR